MHYGKNSRKRPGFVIYLYLRDSVFAAERGTIYQ